MPLRRSREPSRWPHSSTSRSARTGSGLVPGSSAPEYRAGQLAAGHRERERLAPDPPAALVRRAPLARARAASRSRRRCPSRRRRPPPVPPVPPSRSAVQQQIMIEMLAGGWRLPEQRQHSQRLADSGFGSSAWHDSISAWPHSQRGKYLAAGALGSLLTSAAMRVAPCFETAFSSAARARQQQHRPQRPSDAPPALLKLTALPKPCGSLMPAPAIAVSFSTPVLVSVPLARRPAITLLTATGGSLGPQRHSRSGRRHSQNAPGGKPSSGAKDQRKCVPSCIGCASNVGSDPSVTAACNPSTENGNPPPSSRLRRGYITSVRRLATASPAPALGNYPVTCSGLFC